MTAGEKRMEQKRDAKRKIAHENWTPGHSQIGRRPELPLPRMAYPNCFPLYPRRPDLLDLDFFWGKVDTGGKYECWPWLGSMHEGCPCHTFSGRQMPARRVAWLYHRLIGEDHWPAGKRVICTCGHPTCVNPLHLAIGTTKGRGVRLGQVGRWEKIIDPLNDTYNFEFIWHQAERRIASMLASRMAVTA